MKKSRLEIYVIGSSCNYCTSETLAPAGDYKGKVFDAFGLPNNVTTFPSYNIERFFPSIDKHFLNKPNVDYLILDMRYMNSSQKSAVNQYLNSKFSNQLNRLFKLE